jgi:hypothetical protein
MLSKLALPWPQPHKLRVLFYPAAGFDWKLPYFLASLFRRRPDLPGIDLAIYVDYSLDLARQLAKAWAAGDALAWGPGIRAENITAFCPPGPMLWNLRSLGRHAPQGGSGTADAWYALDLRLPQFQLPVLYVPAEAVAFISTVLAPLGLNPTYVATVTDGCRQGGNWCCLSRREGPFFRGLAAADLLPLYWLTDHGDLDFPAAALVGTGLYGKGESTLLAVN